MYFLEAVPANTAVLTTEIFSPPANATFVLKRNDIHVKYLSAERADLNLAEGPYLYERFYIQLQWTPPCAAGFNIDVQALHTVFEGALSTNGSRATYAMPANSTGALLGPMYVSETPREMTISEKLANVVFSLSISQSGTAPDYLWYQLPSAVEVQLLLFFPLCRLCGAVCMQK